jgi:hypothetical protein
MNSTLTSKGRTSALIALVSVALTGAFLAGRARASGIPSTAALTYSGVLEDVNGAPLAGSKEIEIALFDAQLAGSKQCDAKQKVVLVNGRFQVLLPDTCTQAVQAGTDLWIEVSVDGASLGRTKLGAVPYAVEANHAATASAALVAATANAAAGSLASSITALQSDVGALKARADLRVSYKSGNNGTVSCDVFCAGENWGGWTGTCVAAERLDTRTYVGCAATNSTNGLDCWCAKP